ncbi:MAG: dTMP kinase, partial [Acidimicrobiia bacterium]|nr:dTMP kinase [Acidimicrobiia bacterium]
GTVVGEEVRSLLLHGGEMAPWTEALLFAAQRAELAEAVIRPALERGAVVISDRSLYSSLAYQGGARGLGIDEVRTANVLGLGATLPELVVVLDLPVDEALDRQELADRIGSAGRRIQEDVAATYQQLARTEPERIKILGVGAIEETVEAVYQLVVGA